MRKIIVLKISIQIIFVWALLQVGNFISVRIASYVYIPGSLLGMLLLLLLLFTRIIKTEQIEETSGFLLKNMGFFYVPLGVGLLNSVDLFREVWMEFLLIIFLSCILVMFVTSKVTEMLIIFFKEREKHE